MDRTTILLIYVLVALTRLWFVPGQYAVADEYAAGAYFGGSMLFVHFLTNRGWKSTHRAEEITVQPSSTTSNSNPKSVTSANP